MTGAHFPRGAQLRVAGTNVYCTIDRVVGEGGQGTVYAATVGNKAYALKWYRPGMADQDLRRRIPILIDRGSPDPRFLWPIEQITDETSSEGFGYLMPLAPQGFRELFTLFAPADGSAASRVNLRQRAQLGIQIVDCFLKLHASGFCYRDINLGSFLIEPTSFAIRVCDNDNIDINGTSSPSVGTLLFMAPELVRREVPPSADTDLHSLAVLLFYLLTDGHPLLGQAEYKIAYPGADDWQRLLGSEPCFIFDADDGRNAALPGVHDRQIAVWNTLPPGLRDLFRHTFGVGLTAPRRRSLPSEWRPALALVRDTAVKCGCPTQFDTVISGTTSTGESDCDCSLCGAPLPKAHRIEIGETRIVLTLGGHLLASQIGASDRGDDRAVGELTKSPAGLDGLRNLGDAEWRVDDGSGKLVTVPPGRGVTLASGLKIDFGRVTGKVLG